MTVLPPGTILQHEHIRRCVKRNGVQSGRFLDFGAGGGHVSELLLSMGMSGDAYDLNPDSCEVNRERNRAAVEDRRFRVHANNFLELEEETGPYDLVISSMVIEHLVHKDVLQFFKAAAKSLSDNGSIVTIVPGSPDHWGIEDEIAGHQKRYEFECFEALSSETGLRLHSCVGLTYPLSNLLLPLSNRLVKNAESYKTEMSDEEKTVLSGNREVAFKTEFPGWMGIISNRLVMFPFDVLQRMFSRHKSSMVVFAEFKAS